MGEYKVCLCTGGSVTNASVHRGECQVIPSLVMMQVITYDSWDRYTCEGYGWMPLAAHCPGSGTHYVTTWKPQGAVH